MFGNEQRLRTYKQDLGARAIASQTMAVYNMPMATDGCFFSIDV